MAYNLDTSHDSPNYTPASQSPATFGQPRDIKGITIHWWGDPSQNPSFEGVRDYLCRPNGNTSAHYVATGTGRRVACIVAPGDVAWHTGNAVGNATTIGIECDPRCRDEDYDVVAELVADIRSAYGDVLIYSHNMWFNTSCPGNYDIDRIDRLSYTKQSNADWGAVTEKNPKTPAPKPAPQPAPQPTPQPAPAPTPPSPVPTPAPLYRLVVNGAQAGAYSTEANAYAGYVQYGKPCTITLDGNDVTATILSKFDVPAPTTKKPDGTPLPGSGVPASDKPDYSQQNNGLLKQILAIVQAILSRLTGIFK